MLKTIQISYIKRWCCGALMMLLSSCAQDMGWSNINFDAKYHNSFFDEKSGDLYISEYAKSEAEYDTVLYYMYHTAEITTNHQSEHVINDCYAYKHNNTLVLVFSPLTPAYWLNMNIAIVNNTFKAEPTAVSSYHEKLAWETTKQELTLLHNNFNVGDTIAGRCNIEFTEYSYPDSIKGNFYFTGVFKTVVLNMEP